jgi:hypothetical protein
MKMKKNEAKTASVPNGQNSVAAPVKTSITTPSSSPAASVSAVMASGAVTTIEVKLDVGFGNAVFLRGQGGGLNWERGVPLVCVDGKTWRWSGKVNDPLTFKPLLNDRIWAAGNDLTVKPGQRLEVKPTFA